MKRFTLLSIVIVAIFQLQLDAQVSLNIKVYLEGPFNGTEMNTLLNSAGAIPLSQPYDIEPWNYPGTENVAAIPNADIVDWVLIELRETTGDASSATPDKSIHKQAAFLLNNGNIVSLDGTSLLSYDGTITKNLYLIVWHRNHLAILSSGAISETGGIYSWDFTDQQSKAYLDGLKDIGGGKFGMIGGDCDANEWVNIFDKNDSWNEEAGESGYYSCDVNLDAQVNNIDKDEIWLPNKNQKFKLPDAVSFNCGSQLLDGRDEQLYNTVQIGSQCWMAQNLNIGTEIPAAWGQSNNGVIEKFCWGYCYAYGGLYQWDELMDYSTIEGSKGICPDGWHVPTDAEWCTLEQQLDPSITCSSTGWGGTDGGGKLKETGTAHWASPNTGATNSSGFTGLPGGYRHWEWGYITEVGNNGRFWSSSLEGQNAWHRMLSYNSAQVWRWYSTGLNGFSVRCMKDNAPPAPPSNPQPENGSINQPTNTTLSWSCSDPEGDPLTFDVYFGTSNPPPQVAWGLPDNTYNPAMLASNTTYFWKIVARDNHNNASAVTIWKFKTELLWECGNQLNDIDGNFYNTIQIGNQCWMKENMNVGTMIIGSSAQTNNGVIEKYCYNNEPANCSIYGGFYQWDETMQYTTQTGTQGICPSGWHIPSDLDWCILTQYIDPTVNCNIIGFSGTDVGAKMKSTTGWFGGNNGTNTSGFTALPTGHSNEGIFSDLSVWTFFWVSDQYMYYGLYRHLDYAHTTIARDGSTKTFGLSVRCLRNNTPPNPPSNPQPENGAVDQPKNTTLAWSCTDPENDPLTFDVFFGTSNPPPQVASGQLTTTYNPGILNANTTYYWKIVAHDDHNNTSAGIIWQFSTIYEWVCGNVLLDERDDQLYSTVQIGSQCWMAQNLNIGTVITTAWGQSNNGVIEKFCWNCDVYGGLYQWDELMDYSTIEGSQGICPDGWHVPTDAEWCTLEQQLDPTIECSSTWWRGVDGGGKLKETGTAHWVSPNTGATNSCGFTGLPGGYRHWEWGYISEVGNYGPIWSSSLTGQNPWYRNLTYNSAQVMRWYSTGLNGFSARCIRD